MVIRPPRQVLPARVVLVRCRLDKGSQLEMRVGGECAYRIIGRLPNSGAHKRHGLDGYDAFNREVGLIVDSQEIRGFPEEQLVCRLNYMRVKKAY